MPRRRAQEVHDGINSATPLYSRAEYIELLAALVCIYPDEALRRVQGSNKPIFQILWNAAAPARMEWMFNNIRMRYCMAAGRLALLPSGTASNESLHAEINNWFRQTQQLHQATLAVKLEFLTIGKLIAHNAALYQPTCRQMSARTVLARASFRQLWTPTSWQTWCSSQQEVRRVVKAHLPMQREKQVQTELVRAWIAKRPASSEKRSIKRTPFTLKRIVRRRITKKSAF